MKIGICNNYFTHRVEFYENEVMVAVMVGMVAVIWTMVMINFSVLWLAGKPTGGTTSWKEDQIKIVEQKYAKTDITTWW